MSMDFELIQLRGGSIGIKGTGLAKADDAAKLSSLLDKTRPTYDGWIPLLLASPGGDVDQAYETSLVIRDRRLMPVVLFGETCDSACAAILFLAGKRSLLTKGGTLFFHSCITEGGSVDFVNDCNDAMTAMMRLEHEITDEMLGLTLDGFAGNENEVSREMRLIHANVADCLAIDLPPWLDTRPTPTRCGTGDLEHRSPSAAGVDMDTPVSKKSETPPGPVHPVWFLFHWTPPDQWAFWRREDGIALGMRPKGVFRNGPEVRIFCSIDYFGDQRKDDVILDLRLPSSKRRDDADLVALKFGTSNLVGIPRIMRFDEGPYVVDGSRITTSFLVRFPAETWWALANETSGVQLKLVSNDGSTLWQREYPVLGLSKRLGAVRSNCIGALQPVHTMR